MTFPDASYHKLIALQQLSCRSFSITAHTETC